MSKLLDNILYYIGQYGIFKNGSGDVIIPHNLTVSGSLSSNGISNTGNITNSGNITVGTSGDIILANNKVVKGTLNNGTTTANLIGMSTGNNVSLGWNNPNGVELYTNFVSSDNYKKVTIKDGKISGLDSDISLLGQNDAATVEYVSNRLVNYGKGVTLFASSAESLPAQTDTNVKFNTIISGAYRYYFSTSTAPDATGVTVLIPGKYLISGAVQFEGVSGTTFSGKATLHVGSLFDVESYSISTAGANVSAVIPPTFVEVPSGTTNFKVYFTAEASVATRYRGGNNTGRTYMTMQRL